MCCNIRENIVYILSDKVELYEFKILIAKLCVSEFIQLPPQILNWTVAITRVTGYIYVHHHNIRKLGYVATAFKWFETEHGKLGNNID